MRMNVRMYVAIHGNQTQNYVCTYVCSYRLYAHMLR